MFIFSVKRFHSTLISLFLIYAMKNINTVVNRYKALFTLLAVKSILIMVIAKLTSIVNFDVGDLKEISLADFSTFYFNSNDI